MNRHIQGNRRAVRNVRARSRSLSVDRNGYCHLSSRVLRTYTKNDPDSPTLAKLLLCEGLEWSCILFVSALLLSFFAGLLQTFWISVTGGAAAIFAAAAEFLTAAQDVIALI